MHTLHGMPAVQCLLAALLAQPTALPACESSNAARGSRRGSTAWSSPDYNQASPQSQQQRLLQTVARARLLSLFWHHADFKVYCSGAQQQLFLGLQEDEAAVVQQWLAAAQLAQVGMDRLVGTLELIEGEHRFYLQLSSYLCAMTPGLAM